MTKGKVVLCTPSLTGPMPCWIESMKASAPVLKAAGWDVGQSLEIGSPYISCARSTLIRKALDAKADVIVFIDHDMSWRPEDLLKLVEAGGDVVAGTYRFKEDKPHYMGILLDGINFRPIVRPDGALKAKAVPAGFLKITPKAVDLFMTSYPELTYGLKYSPCMDLFNHGACNGQWWGEDYAFSRRWLAIGGEIWIIPDINLNHHSADKVYPGNFHEFMLAQPGGSNDPVLKALRPLVPQ